MTEDREQVYMLLQQPYEVQVADACFDGSASKSTHNTDESPLVGS
jgi:hypothetical protein